MKILRAMSWMLLMGLLPVSGAWAKNLAGFVIVSVGDVTAMDTEKGQQRKLERRSKIFAGDEIRTGENAKVQLKFKDKGVIALEENTALEITDYEFSGIDGQSERSFFKLVKGGFSSRLILTLMASLSHTRKPIIWLYTPFLLYTANFLLPVCLVPFAC